MSRSAPRLARATRWLPLVLVVGLAGPSITDWSSAVTVLAQADSGDQQPANTGTPAADTASPVVEEAPAGDLMPAPAADGSAPVVEETPADDAMPAPAETMPAADGTPAPSRSNGDVLLCIEVTRTPNGSVNVVTQPCQPDSP
jgi:hypothetical protein